MAGDELAARQRVANVGRFLALGALDTAVTSAAFYALTGVMAAQLAFTIVYLGGLAFVTVATPRFVFRRTATLARRLALASWYVAVYCVALIVIHVLTDAVDASRVVVV